MTNLSARQRVKIQKLIDKRDRLEDRIAMLMSQRVEIEEQMAAVYDEELVA